MSDANKDDDKNQVDDEPVSGEEGGDVDETSAAPDRLDEGESETAPTPEIVVEKKRGASATIAWLALFLSLITLAGVGYLTLEKYRGDSSAAEESNTVAALSAEVGGTNESLADLTASIGDLGAKQTETGELLESLRRDLDDRGQLFDSLPPRMTNIERSVSSLQGVSLDTRNTYLVAEAEYYLQIANSQLQLAGNSYLASLALDQADDRLLQLGDPALTDVRRAIANEMAALEVMEKPDIAGLTLTLASLARVVESLPLRQPKDAAEPAAVVEPEAQSGAARAWGAVKNTVSGLVKHTPPGDDTAALLTPDAEPLIRNNLALQLQAARLALLRGETAVFAQSLEDADAWLLRYFDTSSTPVAGARATIADIQDDYAVSAAPDISGSLRLLRQYKALLEPEE